MSKEYVLLIAEMKQAIAELESAITEWDDSPQLVPNDVAVRLATAHARVKAAAAAIVAWWAEESEGA